GCCACTTFGTAISEPIEAKVSKRKRMKQPFDSKPRRCEVAGAPASTMRQPDGMARRASARVLLELVADERDHVEQVCRAAHAERHAGHHHELAARAAEAMAQRHALALGDHLL